MNRPFLGFGLGLRKEHYDAVLAEHPPVDWFEILSENYMVQGGKPLHYLDRIRQDYPVVMHGVSLSIGSSDPLNLDYLRDLKSLAERVQPEWVSDHLCWTGVGGHNFHDLLPMPYTRKIARHVAERVRQVQDILGRQILLENLSSYVSFEDSEMSEWEFVTEVVQSAGCLLLLDVNNVYVSSINHGFDPMDYIRGVPPERVWQIHLAGHTTNASGKIMIDTHDMPIRDEVLDLYAQSCELLGPVSTMIERDDNIPPLPELLDELQQVREVGSACWGMDA
ncbi:MNIO family bufferin maturase [Thiolapillus sp.]